MITRWMRNISDKFTEYIKTHILLSIAFFFTESRTVYEAKDDKVIRCTKDAMRMRDS